MDAEQRLASYRHRVGEIHRRATETQRSLATAAGAATSSAPSARQVAEAMRPLLGDGSAAMGILRSEPAAYAAHGRRP